MTQTEYFSRAEISSAVPTLDQVDFYCGFIFVNGCWFRPPLLSVLKVLKTINCCGKSKCGYLFELKKEKGFLLDLLHTFHLLQFLLFDFHCGYQLFINGCLYRPLVLCVYSTEVPTNWFGKSKV